MNAKSSAISSAKSSVLYNDNLVSLILIPHLEIEDIYRFCSSNTRFRRLMFSKYFLYRYFEFKDPGRFSRIQHLQKFNIPGVNEMHSDMKNIFIKSLQIARIRRIAHTHFEKFCHSGVPLALLPHLEKNSVNQVEWMYDDLKRVFMK